MQAITVKYLGPTNTRGSRYRATCDARSITLAQDYALSPYTNAVRAAKELAMRLEWRGIWHGGTLPERNSEAFVFVCLPKGDVVGDFVVTA